jgi:hypothetical protein
MGGLTEPLGLGKSDSTHPSNVWFLQQIYDNIYSGAFGYFYDTENEEDASLDPDDYFDIACWHPYVWNKTALDEDYFVQENNKVYQVILDNEKKHKKVFLSEVGFTDLSRGEEIATESVKRMFHAVSTRMPYVETVDVFKLYDLMPSETESDGDRYGFFYDPNPNHTYYKIDDSSAWNTTSEVCTPGAAKLLAYVFQELAGGSGSLELMKNYYAK